MAILRVLALTGAVCGVWMLQAGWRLRVRSWPHVVGGWSLIICSLVAWSFTSGADKGAALGIVTGMIIALSFLTIIAFKSAPRLERPTRKRKAIADNEVGMRIIFRRIYASLLIGPIAGLVALAFSTAAFVGLQAVKVEHTINLTIVSFAFPFFWAGLSVIAGYQTKLWHNTITVIGVGLCSLACLWIAT